MSNPISDLYIKFMEKIDPYLRRYPYLVGIIGGGLFFFGAIIMIFSLSLWLKK